MNVVYNMDCMEAMREMPDKCFDLAVVDPIYGIGENGAKSGPRTKLAIGSGSSRIAAYNEGLDFVGFETDPDYFREQEERYEAHIAQLSLFREVGPHD